MENQEETKKIAKGLLKESEVLCKLYGGNTVLEAKTADDKKKTLTAFMETRLGFGFKGKVANIIRK